MSVERVVHRKKILDPLGLRNFVAEKIVVPIMVKDMPRLISAIHPIFDPRFEEEYAKRMREKNITRIAVCSHTSHMDGPPLAAVIRELTNIDNKISSDSATTYFIVPIAISMETGDQGEVVQRATQRLTDFMSEKHLIKARPYTRDKDIEIGIADNTYKFMKQLIQDIRDGNDIAIFPEATMQAGRSGKRNILQILLFQKPKRHGMQPFKDIDVLARAVQAAGNEPMYVFVGIDGGFNLEDPSKRRPTLRYMKEAYITHPKKTKLVSVRVGLPMTHQELMEEAKQQGNDNPDINHLLGRKVAPLLPPQARGVYR